MAARDRLTQALQDNLVFFEGKTLKEMHEAFCKRYEYMAFDYFRMTVQKWKKANGYKMNTGEGKSWEKSNKQ